MDKTTAQKINALMLEIGAKLDESTQMVKENCSEEDFKTYRSAIGKLLGVMLLDVMNPLYARYPDLKPRKLD